MPPASLPGLEISLRALAGGDLPDWPQLAPHTRQIELGAGELLFRSGAIDAGVYCVRRGLLKLVYEDGQGRLFIKGFIEAGRPFASAAALAEGGRTRFAAFAIEPCLIERVEFAPIARLARSHLPWALALARAFQDYGERKERREHELLTLDAETRYRNFLQSYPTLLGRVAQKDIAAYLGVTPVGLSRIKRRVDEATARARPGAD